MSLFILLVIFLLMVLIVAKLLRKIAVTLGLPWLAAGIAAFFAAKWLRGEHDEHTTHS